MESQQKQEQKNRKESDSATPDSGNGETATSHP